MEQKTCLATAVNPVVSIYLILLLHFAYGLKCELKGMINNRVQCVLHDRGLNVININDSLDMHPRLRKLRQEQQEVWRYSTGLDINRTFFPGRNGAEFKKFIRSTMPGTKWCGDLSGDSPITSEDLEFFVKTEKCCKEHLGCRDTLAPKQTRSELTNIGILRRFHCDCDKNFHNCLKMANTGRANKIGFTYFNVLGPQCFKEDNPVINCTKKKAGRCVLYKFNRTEEKKYQWFDLPTY